MITSIEKGKIKLSECEFERDSSNDKLVNFIFDNFDVVEKLKKSTYVFVVDIVDDVADTPKFSFIFNKGYVKGKTLCVICIHEIYENKWHTKMTEPLFKDGRTWVSGEFTTPKREKEFYSIIENGTIWNDI